MWETSWTWNFLARQARQPSSEHGSYWNKLSPWLLSCYRMWQKLCWIQCFSRESGLLGTGSRAGTAANHSFPGDSSQEQTCLSMTARGHCCLSCCCFFEERPQARKSGVVCKPASSCCFSLPALSVGGRTLGHSGEAFLGVNCRAGGLSWQEVCWLCCGDLCCSLATVIWRHSWVYRWHSMVATRDNCMNRFRSARLGRRKTSKTSFLCFVLNFIPFIFSLFCAMWLYAISTCQWSDRMPVFSFVFCRIKAWVDKMQEDLVTLARTASGVDRLADVRRDVLDCCN